MLERQESGRSSQDIPGRQPSDAAVEAAYKAASEIWGHGPYAAIDAALEAAYRVDAPRSLLDREAVAKSLRSLACWRDPQDEVERYVDEVVGLARPMPTREQIEHAVRAAGIGSYSTIVTEALLALLNGDPS